jgi:hypothetical protein
MILKHPILQVGIFNAESTRPMWVQRIDIKQHVTWHFMDPFADFDNASLKFTASEVDGTFPELEIRPGWRILILCQETTNTMEIHFTWNHLHADGISGKIFQEDLCQSLNTQTLQDERLSKTGTHLSSSFLRFHNSHHPLRNCASFPSVLSSLRKLHGQNLAQHHWLGPGHVWPNGRLSNYPHTKHNSVPSS